MPQEPDNTKMDELLKAYAKKRQEASGAPLQVPPGTRRLLQNEVARVYPKTEAPEVIPWYKLLFQFWPRVAFALGMVVLLGSAFWALNQPPAEPQTMSIAQKEAETLDSVAPRKPENTEVALTLQKKLSVVENTPAPAPTPTPAGPSGMSAPAVPSQNQAKKEMNVRLADQVSRSSASEKQKAAANTDEQNRARLYRGVAAPAEAPAKNEQLAAATDGAALSTAARPGISGEAKSIAPSQPPAAAAPVDYYYATTWTNLANSPALSWDFQSPQLAEQGAGRFSDLSAAASQAPAAGKSLEEKDNDFVGSFGNVGGDGRFARSRAQQDRVQDAPPSAPAPAPEILAQNETRGYALAKGAPSTPALSAPAGGLGAAQGPASVFYSQNPAALGGAAPAAQAPAPRVLENFQLIQQGEVLQLVDADGSIYEGKLQVVSNSGDASKQNEAPLVRQRTDDSARPAAESLVRERNNSNAPVTVATTFKATGLNRTLGQTVVVNGRLERQLIPYYDNSGFGTSPRPSQPAPTAAARRPSSTTTTNAPVRISGTAIIGGTNHIRLEAVPTGR